MNIEARLSSSVATSRLFYQGDARTGSVEVRSTRVLVIGDDPSIESHALGLSRAARDARHLGFTETGGRPAVSRG